MSRVRVGPPPPSTDAPCCPKSASRRACAAGCSAGACAPSSTSRACAHRGHCHTASSPLRAVCPLRYSTVLYSTAYLYLLYCTVCRTRTCVGGSLGSFCVHDWINARSAHAARYGFPSGKGARDLGPPGDTAGYTGRQHLSCVCRYARIPSIHLGSSRTALLIKGAPWPFISAANAVWPAQWQAATMQLCLFIQLSSAPPAEYRYFPVYFAVDFAHGYIVFRRTGNLIMPAALVGMVVAWHHVLHVANIAGGYFHHHGRHRAILAICHMLLPPTGRPSQCQCHSSCCAGPRIRMVAARQAVM